MDDPPHSPLPPPGIADKLKVNEQHSCTFIWADSEEAVMLKKQHRCNAEHFVAFGEISWMNETWHSLAEIQPNRWSQKT